MRIINETDYSGRDLRRFFTRGLRAMGARGRLDKVIRVAYSRKGAVWGCASLSETHRAARSMMFALPRPPKALDLGEFARVLRHERAHNLGLLHGEMDHDLRYCAGPAPAWVEGLTIAHKGPKPKPSTDDRREARRARLVASLARWESKAKRAANAIRKARAGLRRLDRALAARPAAPPSTV